MDGAGAGSGAHGGGRNEEVTMENEYEGATPDVRSTEELRAEMFKILDELVTSRAERTKVLSAEFKALWDQVPDAEPAIH
jgi:hypothetical protein